MAAAAAIRVAAVVHRLRPTPAAAATAAMIPTGHPLHGTTMRIPTCVSLCGVNTPGLLVGEATTGTITAIPLATAAVVVATPLRPTQLMEGEQLPTICLRAAMVAVVLTTGAFILSLAGVVFIVLISQTLGIPHMMIGTYESGTITDRAPTTSGTVATKVMIVPVYTMNAIGIAVAP